MVWCLMESSVKLGRPVGLLVAIRRLAGSYLVCLLVGHPVAIRSACWELSGRQSSMLPGRLRGGYLVAVGCPVCVENMNGLQ